MEREVEASRQLELTNGDQGDPGHRQRDGCCRRAAARPARWPCHSRDAVNDTSLCGGLARALNPSLKSFEVGDRQASQQCHTLRF